jgi:hypothetical protein
MVILVAYSLCSLKNQEIKKVMFTAGAGNAIYASVAVGALSDMIVAQISHFK